MSMGPGSVILGGTLVGGTEPLAGADAAVVRGKGEGPVGAALPQPTARTMNPLATLRRFTTDATLATNMEAPDRGVFGKFLEFAGNLMGATARLRVGEFTFDATTRQLVRGGQSVHLSPKAFDLLKLLIDERPRVVSKDELFRRLWPDSFVADVNLASLVAEVRNALGDHARHSRFIRTSHRVGYAFCAEGVPVADAPESAAVSAFCWLLKDGRRIPLRPGSNVLGRDADGIQIDSPTVSRRHACIRIEGTHAVIDDLGSKNGTFVDGQPVITTVVLTDGVEIRAGSVVFSFRMTLPNGATATWAGA